VLFLQAAMKKAPNARNILVVDDEADIREAIQDLLASEFDGATIHVAGSGPEALSILRHEAMDLILTDYKMPGMSGVKFLAEADKIAPGIPRIILTAFDRELIRELGASSRRERILQKPFEPEALIKVVSASLASSSA